MIRFLIVGSGSKGNATLVYDENTLFQIDMGVPYSRVTAALTSIGRAPSDIQGILITHDHIDHVGTLATLPSGIETYTAAGNLPHPDHLFVAEEPFPLGSFYITPLPLSHDATNPMGFLISHAGEKLVYVTDTGYLPAEDLPYLKGATYYIFESNHDLEMLRRSARPMSLKKRIRSDVGHLSNKEAAEYLAALVSDATRGLYLAHLSEECNTPELALRTFHEVFHKKGRNLEDYHPVCAKQWEPTPGGDL